MVRGPRPWHQTLRGWCRVWPRRARSTSEGVGTRAVSARCCVLWRAPACAPPSRGLSTQPHSREQGPFALSRGSPCSVLGVSCHLRLAPRLGLSRVPLALCHTRSSARPRGQHHPRVGLTPRTQRQTSALVAVLALRHQLLRGVLRLGSLDGERGVSRRHRTLHRRRVYPSHQSKEHGRGHWVRTWFLLCSRSRSGSCPSEALHLVGGGAPWNGGTVTGRGLSCEVDPPCRPRSLLSRRGTCLRGERGSVCRQWGEPQWGEPFRKLTPDSHEPLSGIICRFNRYCAYTDFWAVDECCWFT